MTLRRWLMLWATIGFTIAVFWLLAAELFSVGYDNRVLYMWPAAVLTMVNFGHEGTPEAASVMLLSASLNAVLYALVGVILWLPWRLTMRKSDPGSSS